MVATLLHEIPLQGGDVTDGVVRVGDTVRRPVGQAAPAVHALLGHLESVGFRGAPRFVGIDGLGREILTYVEGRSGLCLANSTDDFLVELAVLIREFHDATVGFPLAAGGWEGGSNDDRAPEVIGHCDLTPDNVIFRMHTAEATAPMGPTAIATTDDLTATLTGARPIAATNATSTGTASTGARPTATANGAAPPNTPESNAPNCNAVAAYTPGDGIPLPTPYDATVLNASRPNAAADSATPGSSPAGAVSPGSVTPNAATRGSATSGAVTPGSLTLSAASPSAASPGAAGPSAATPVVASPVGFIDFDLARPTTRLFDIVTTLRHWAPIADPVDRPPLQRNVDVGARIRLFCDAYGLPSRDRRRLLELSRLRFHRSYDVMRTRATAGGSWARMWAGGAGQRIRRAAAWLDVHEDELHAHLV